jgi:Eukaryotic protein of unknown function (DUF866)
MPTFVLHVKCTLEGVAKLEADANTTWILTVESQDGSESREGVYISRNEEIPLDGSKGIAHFVVKFKGANKQVSMNVRYCQVVDACCAYVNCLRYHSKYA